MGGRGREAERWEMVGDWGRAVAIEKGGSGGLDVSGRGLVDGVKVITLGGVRRGRWQESNQLGEC